MTGKVTLDGMPLPVGQIIFVDAEGSPPRQYGGEIKDGVYSVESTPGKKKVEITATASSIGSKDPGSDLKQIIPPQFNQQTTLAAEIPPDGKGSFDYAITSEVKK